MEKLNARVRQRWPKESGPEGFSTTLVPTSAFSLSSPRDLWETPEKSSALNQIMKLRRDSRAISGRTTLRILRWSRRVLGPQAECRISLLLIFRLPIVVWEHLSPKTPQPQVRGFAALRLMISVSMPRHLPL